MIANHFPLELTLGAVYFGATIAAVFYGITILQTVIYYKQYPNDPWIFRYTVAVLWILDTLSVIFSTYTLYFYMVKSSGDYSALLDIIWYAHLTSVIVFGLTEITGRSFPLQLLVNMLTVVGVQALYAFRIWKLGRRIHKVIPWSIFLAVAASLGETSFVIMNEDLNVNSKAPEFTMPLYDLSQAKLVTRYTLSSPFGIPTISTSIYVVFSTLAGADFFIAATMCYYLDKHS
ncbi:hypothetical protein ARMGADRAFT_1093018 [Armillaria gallica]|uniref:Uncharacterized protein n=1 Tax=Armillaria gallica TaxID=47427 RepID=A0A2H3CK54_ARMGA|nr:hypothetical protein ARMGADRAFT_1093018 [Armillaria gallica]